MRKNNQYKFFKKVMELSESKKWNEAKKEWEQIEITEVDNEEDYGECICGKNPIKEMIQMFNKLNHNEIIVGNCCINRFFGIKGFNKIFGAIKKGKINKAIIEDVYSKKRINYWEYNFLIDVWRKKKLSEKQSKKLENLKIRILNLYKSLKKER